MNFKLILEMLLFCITCTSLSFLSWLEKVATKVPRLQQDRSRYGPCQKPPYAFITTYSNVCLSVLLPWLAMLASHFRPFSNNFQASFRKIFEAMAFRFLNLIFIHALSFSAYMSFIFLPYWNRVYIDLNKANVIYEL